MKKIRAVLIGAGSPANMAHYPSLRNINNAEIVGICDLDKDRLRETAERYTTACRMP